MTVVTNKKECQTGWRFTLWLQFKQFKKIHFLWHLLPNNIELSIIPLMEARGLLENNIKQLKYYIYHVYIFFGTGKKANVQLSLFNLVKLCSNFRLWVTRETYVSHQRWQDHKSLN